jgi:UV DNA damage endonuclease
MRLGLCCAFHVEPIRFRTTTATALARLPRAARVTRLREIASHNAAALRAAIEYCTAHDIGCFRVNSEVLPLRTHPEHGYDSELLGEGIVEAFRDSGRRARESGVRLTFHPDQFVVLSSPHRNVVRSSLAELEHHAEVAEWIGADVINIHAGGGYGDKASALARLSQSVEHLSQRARERLSIENDDRTYSPRDLLPICHELEIPLVYDVHHHRCHSDGLSVEAATKLAAGTWRREPLFHVSSPRNGWRGEHPRRHADFIRLSDFPSCWEGMDCTVEVEAKAKESAVLKLSRALRRRARGRETRRGLAFPSAI